MSYLTVEEPIAKSYVCHRGDGSENWFYISTINGISFGDYPVGRSETMAFMWTWANGGKIGKLISEASGLENSLTNHIKFCNDLFSEGKIL